ncbi:hypothetical protein CANARDRAFT_137885 [[Candida] arabinofermentans NRRL YB-2248]|uniref:Uncharacterized protein n=1 Tax=[Candida] arabinofermentans NRRL YB-2248 TaxID=983967 RepID=A0A1E4T1P1_9ASCO|nr:hypothetical protein CANARDRAFT_137885 [[Candida] arabinofermentans NRRL YB-2248]
MKNLNKVMKMGSFTEDIHKNTFSKLLALATLFHFGALDSLPVMQDAELLKVVYAQLRYLLPACHQR